MSDVDNSGGTAAAPVHRYQFPAQETELRGGEELCCVGGAKFSKVQTLSMDDRTVEIKKRKDSAKIHPEGVFAHTLVRTEALKESLVRPGEYVAEHGLLGNGRYQGEDDLRTAVHGKKVRVTANSRKIIRNLIAASIKAADESGVDLPCCHKANEKEAPQNPLFFTTRNEDLLAAFDRGASVGGSNRLALGAGRRRGER